MADMSDLAVVLGKMDETQKFTSITQRNYPEFQKAFFDEETGLFRDGARTEHSTFHVNLFHRWRRDCRAKVWQLLGH